MYSSTVCADLSYMKMSGVPVNESVMHTLEALNVNLPWGFCEPCIGVRHALHGEVLELVPARLGGRQWGGGGLELGG